MNPWVALFPGQGSQSVGMGKFLHENFALVRTLFEEASDTLNVNMSKLCFEGPDADLAKTENTQPSLLLVSTAYFRVFREEFGFRPLLAAGHSLGEYSALVAAGVLPFSDALRAVRSRGLAMQQACPLGEGGMAAVMGLEPAEVEALCLWTEKTSGFSPLSPANYNSPGQIVISGTQKALDWLLKNYDPQASGIGKKARLIPLNVSAPFHSPLMKPAQETMQIELQKISWTKPEFPIVQNTTAKDETSPEVLRQQLTLQVSAPVRWMQSVARIREIGGRSLIEFGPGKVLAGLVKKIDSDSLTTWNIQSIEDFKAVGEKYRETSR